MNQPTALLALSAAHESLFFPPDLAAELQRLLPNARRLRPRALSPDQWESSLLQANPEILLTSWSTRAISGSLIPQLNKLRYICHLTGTPRPAIPRAALEAGIVVTNWGNLPSPYVAENALALILSVLRCTSRFDSDLKQGLWRESAESQESLVGKRVGIHGFGAIARALVPLLRPFSVSLQAYSEPVPSEVFAQRGVSQASSLAELFSQSDILIEAEALNPHTRHSIDRSLLQRLHPEGVFINIGRADLVVEEDLLQLARAGLRVGLDVFHQEPLAPDSPWRRLPRAVLTPHISFPTPDTYPLCGRQALDNLQRYLHQQPLHDQLTPEIYDRIT